MLESLAESTACPRLRMLSSVQQPAPDCFQVARGETSLQLPAVLEPAPWSINADQVCLFTHTVGYT